VLREFTPAYTGTPPRINSPSRLLSMTAGCHINGKIRVLDATLWRIYVVKRNTKPTVSEILYKHLTGINIDEMIYYD
jgi:hypothetical protein